VIDDERRTSRVVRGVSGNRGPTAEWLEYLDRRELARSLFKCGWRPGEIAQYLGLARERVVEMLREEP
jgi:hypothetical protein